MAEVVVGRAFLSPVIQLICERLASTDFRDYFDKGFVIQLKTILNFINPILDDAEPKQYENLDLKNWLDDLSHVVYEVEQLSDVVATDAAQQKGKIQRFISGSINRFEPRISVLLKRLLFLAKKKHGFGLRELTNYYYEDGASDFATSSFMDESIIYGRERVKEEITSSFMDESIIYGRERVKEEIIKFLLLDSYNDELSVISIVGLKGMGKTALAQLVYNDRRILEQFEFKAWVHVSESFDCHHLINEILDHQLQHRLAGNKYLLVLDDARIKNRNMSEYLLPLFTHGYFRGKMIVTTNDKEVASVMRSTRIIHLRQLEESDSWSLFARHAFEGRISISIYSVLRMSYLSLPSSLKRCFAYCSIFPKGYEFEKDGLIKLWMAQGLLKGIMKNEEELGNKFFNDLVSMSFFQQSAIMPFWAGKYYFIMHDLVNDLATSMSGEFCLRIEGVKVQDIPQRTRHIWCCLDLVDDDRKLKQIRNIKGLQSLMVEEQGYGEKRFKISTNVQQSLFSKLKYLLILSFSGCNLLELADEIRNLKLLRYLDVSYTEITSLPNSICMLYNLHTLLLEECFKLTELPSNFGKLINLRHLNLKGTHIKKMPKEIRLLINLEMLTDFVVGEQHGYDIKQLAELNHLKGRLQISGLKNVADPTDAMAGNLKDKKHLQELIMSYDEWREMDGSETEARVSVLEALQPNTNLMRLTINDYRGRSFPNWLGDHLPYLVSLELLGCKLCSQLPPLGQFPSLKKLSLSCCHGVEIIGSEFCGYNSSFVPFKSLETLRVEHMYEWKEWLCLEGFPLLQELCIKHCPKLKSALPPHLPCLQKLEIIDCEELEASIPKAANISELELKRCDGILINKLPSRLKKVILCGTQVIECALEKILFNSAFLEELEVEDFFGPNIEWSSLDMCSCNSLHTLTITGWHSSSLPFALHLFTNLHSLVLYDCPWLESFFGRPLPSNLGRIRIERCPNLMASIEEWGLFQLKSLKQFSLSDDFQILESFPEESMLPSTINSLELTNCSNLRKINYKGLLHLTSLESLYIDDCPCLESLPEEGLPISLSTLSIHDCPLLKQLYQKEQGERWHTISHIPYVTIS